jgi:hypothetical protein
MSASNATEEQRLALREALKGQIANMRALQAAAEKDKQEQQELLARIAAMEGKVGKGLFDDVAPAVILLLHYLLLVLVVVLYSNLFKQWP